MLTPKKDSTVTDTHAFVMHKQIDARLLQQMSPDFSSVENDGDTTGDYDNDND